MRRTPLVLLAAALLAAGLCHARQDPEPPSPGLEKLLGYVLDDADCVGVLDVKRLLAAPAYRKHVKAEADRMLAVPPVAAVLAKFGVDPRRDLDRVLVALNRHSFPPGGPEKGPLMLFQGRFNEKKLHEGMAWLMKDYNLIKKAGEGRDAVYSVERDVYVAAVSDSLLVLTGDASFLRQVREKVTGKRKTRLENRELEKLLGTLREDAVARFAGAGSMPAGESWDKDPKTGKRVHRVLTLADQGFSQVTARAVVGEELRWSLRLVGKSKEAFPEAAKRFRQGVGQTAARMKGARGSEGKVGELLAAAKLSETGTTLSLEGACTGPEMAALVEAILKEAFGK